MEHTNIVVIMIIIAVMFFCLVSVLVKTALKNEKNIYQNGIETDSVVSRVDYRLNGNRGSGRHYYCYVTFTGNDGLEHEALLNLSSNLPIGRKVKIKYLPPQYDKAVFVSQEL